MTDLTPVPGASAVPQLETNTIALGGTGNPMNMQAQALLNRSALNAQNIEALAAEVTEMQGVEGRVDALESHNSTVVDPSISRSGEANEYAWGNVKQNETDFASFGPNLAPAFADFTKTNFSATGVHGAGTVGTLSAPAAIPAFTFYKLVLTVLTTAPGGLQVNLGTQKVFSDTPDGYYFSNEPILADGIEQDRVLSTTVYTFMAETSGAAQTSISVVSDLNWAGQITGIDFRKVDPTKFSVAGAGTGNGTHNPIGMKAVGYNRNDVVLGDKYTLGMLYDDGLPLMGAHNVAIGSRALASNAFGNENTAVGTYAMQYNEGTNNVAVGYSSFKLNTKGQENTGIGFKSGVLNTTGFRNTYTGFWCFGQQTTGNENTGAGWFAGRNLKEGARNTFLGARTGQLLNKGNDNTFVGALAGYAAGEGVVDNKNLVGVGSQATPFGSGAIAMGYAARAGTQATPSQGSIAIGEQASAMGYSPSVSVGKEAQATGARSTSIGHQSKSPGDLSVAMGGLSEANGTGSVSVGVQSGIGSTGQNNVFLGRQAGGLAVNAFENCVLLGMGTTVTGSNQVQLGGTGTTPYAYVALQIRSDARDKIDARKLTKCIEFIRGLKFKEYRNNFREDYFDEVEREIEVDEQFTSYDAEGVPTVTTRKVLKTFIERVPVENDGSRAGERFRAGVFAQEVKALCEELGIDWAGLQHHAVEGGKDVYTVAYELLIPYLGEATQHLLDRQDELEARLIALEQKA